MTRILVVGRTGQLAQELARSPLPRDWAMDFAGRDAIDLSDPDAAAKAVRASGADAVINAAAYTAVDRAESEAELAQRVNGDAPGGMAAAARAMGAPFVHVSTDYVFDGQNPEGYAEDDAIAPQSVYGATKAAGEAAVRAAGGEHLILRTSWVFSPFGANFVKTMLRVGAERDEVRVVDDQHGRPTAAGDIARTLVVMLEKTLAGAAPFGTYHFANTGPTTWRKFADGVFERAAARGAKTPKVTAITTAEYPTPARRPACSILKTGKLEAAFGLAPRGWGEALDATLDELVGPRKG
jgi:dTDP-4-dehydrorhamnose reductase